MKNIKDLLYEITDNGDVYKEDIDLIESNILDSLAIIRLFSYLEENDIDIQITRIDRTKLRNVKGIEELIKEHTTVK